MDIRNLKNPDHIWWSRNDSEDEIALQAIRSLIILISDQSIFAAPDGASHGSWIQISREKYNLNLTIENTVR